MRKLNNNNLPKGWQKVKLGEITKVFGGGTPSTSNPNYWNGNIPWLTPAEVVALRGNRFIEKTDRYITEEGLRHSSAKLIPAYSLLLTSRATIGEVVINKIPMATNQGFINIIPDKIDLMFLFYWLRMKKNYLNKMAVGSTFNELSKSVFKKIEIIYPEDINEQKRIAEILSAFDDKIELNNKLIKTLEKMASAIFKEWFVKFKFPGWEKVKFVDSELGKIPEGWEVKDFETIMEFLNGRKPPENIFSPSGRYYIYGSNTIMGRSEKFLYEGPIIVLARIGSNCGALRLNISPCWISNNATGIKGKDNISTFFVYLLLKNFDFSQIKEGTGQPYINIKALKSYKVILPASNILYRFDELVSNFYFNIHQKVEENQKLSALRDLLLPKLMSGEIRIWI